MSDLPFVTYQRFMNQQDAQELAELLTENSVEFQLENGTTSFDPSFANNAVNHEFRIKLQQKDFQPVDELLLQTSSELLESIGQDYYLFEFTDVELFEILEKRDEWSKFDFLLAQKLLKERGCEISETQLDAMRAERLKELAHPEKNQTSWVAIGYISALLGGLFGMFMGWHLYTHKKTLPNGNRVYDYSQSNRKHGVVIFFLGLVCFVLFLFLRWSKVQLY